MNEEDFRLFHKIKEKPIRSCVELSRAMRGYREGFIFFTESFRIDFEKRMSRLARLEVENKKLREEIEENKLIG